MFVSTNIIIICEVRSSQCVRWKSTRAYPVPAIVIRHWRIFTLYLGDDTCYYSHTDFVQGSFVHESLCETMISNFFLSRSCIQNLDGISLRPWDFDIALLVDPSNSTKQRRFNARFNKYWGISLTWRLFFAFFSRFFFDWVKLRKL